MNFRNFVENSERKKTKLFGTAANRVTTEELQTVFQELKSLLYSFFPEMEPVRFLPTKQDHGDIDILVVGTKVQEILKHSLGDKILQMSKNGHVISVLYNSPSLGKAVHVDFIVSNHKLFATRRHFYAMGDSSAVIGIVAKNLHFKYGTEGFFKRFRDMRGNWHDILITYNLSEGLRILGFPRPEELRNIKTNDDIVEFVKTTPMFNSNWFRPEEMKYQDRQSVNRRAGMEYICSALRDSGVQSSINQEDYFFEKLFPEQYKRVDAEKQRINQQTYIKSNVYDGNWVMKVLGIHPGPNVGLVLKAITQRFGDNLTNVPEEEVKQFVMGFLGKTSI
jgi:hypothetical protein